MRGFSRLRTGWMVIAAAFLIPACLAQSFTTGSEGKSSSLLVREPAICAGPTPENSGKAALRLVCARDTSAIRNMAVDKAIIIGFVGGFVGSDDVRHPEVQFAAYLRETYPSAVHAEVFANHDGKHALRRVLQLLGSDGEGTPTSSDKQQTKIIIYGHSWGGSQAVNLARQLDRLGIPVSLAILVDSVHKPGHNDAVIPPNVRNAINFYQTKGLIHGRSRVRAADPNRTNLIGNFEIEYRDRRINCQNYPWIARHLNRPHHEIENDPLVWRRIASLVDSELFPRTVLEEASVSSDSAVVREAKGEE